MHARASTTSSTGRGMPDDAERVDTGQDEQRDRQRHEGVHGKASLRVPASVRQNPPGELSGEKVHAEGHDDCGVLTSTVAT